MSELWLVEKETIEGIADATKEKLLSTDKMLVGEIEENIRSISGPKPEQTKTIEVTTNGTYTVEPDEGQVLTGVTITEANPFQNNWTKLLNRSIVSISDEDVANLSEYKPYVFGHCYNLTHIAFPPNITSIGSRCFFACTKLGTTENLIIPATVKNIGEYAFASCTGLTKVSIRGKPDSIAINAFSNCGNIAHAYVSWGQGEVANEPWGLSESKCQIHWNYGS